MASCHPVGALWHFCHTERKGFQGKVGMAVGSGVFVSMWLVCDVEMAEVGSKRLCRMGLLKEGGNGTKVWHWAWCASSAGVYPAWT